MTCQGSSKTAPGWEYQLTAAIGHQRTAWAALADVTHTVPATRTAQTIAQVKSVLRRLSAAGHGMKAAPLFIFDAGYSAAALTDGLPGCPVHVLVRLAAGSVFYAIPSPGKAGHRQSRQMVVSRTKDAGIPLGSRVNRQGVVRVLYVVESRNVPVRQ
jgi:hypothetical protein